MMKNPAFYTKNEKGEIIPPIGDWTDVADLNYDIQINGNFEEITLDVERKNVGLPGLDSFGFRIFRRK